MKKIEVSVPPPRTQPESQKKHSSRQRTMPGSNRGLDGARQDYASSKVTDLSTQLQEISVATFEVQHSRRQVYVKLGNLMYLTPRPDAESSLKAREKDVGEKLAMMQAVAGGSRPHAG